MIPKSVKRAWLAFSFVLTLLFSANDVFARSLPRVYTDEELDYQIEHSTPSADVLLIRGRRRMERDAPRLALDDFLRINSDTASGKGPLRDIGLAYVALGEREKGRALLVEAWEDGDFEAGHAMRELNMPFRTRWVPFSFLVWPPVEFPRESSEKHVRGFALGLGNEARSVGGLQAGPIAVLADDLSGVQASLFSFAGTFRGVQLGGFSAISGSAEYEWRSRHSLPASWGIQGSLFAAGADRLYGTQVAPIVFSNRFRGIQVGGIAAGGRINGVQVGVLNYGERFDGLQIGGWNISGKRLSGTQIGGINIAGGSKELTGHRGVQVGFVNACSSSFSGVQLGVFNVSERLSGVQVGVVNVVRNPTHLPKVLPIVNASW